MNQICKVATEALNLFAAAAAAVTYSITNIPPLLLSVSVSPPNFPELGCVQQK